MSDLLSTYYGRNTLMDDQPPAPHDLMQQPSTADVRRKLAEQIVQRGNVLPVAEYADGHVGLAWPSFLHAPAESWTRLWDNRSHIRDNPSLVGDAFQVAGTAMTGGFGLSAAGVKMAPRGALGANRFTLDHHGTRISVLENPTPAELAGFIRRTKYKAARILDDPATGAKYAWDAGDPLLHSHVAEQLGVKLAQSERGKIAIIDDLGRLAHE